MSTNEDVLVKSRCKLICPEKKIFQPFNIYSSIIRYDLCGSILLSAGFMLRAIEQLGCNTLNILKCFPELNGKDRIVVLQETLPEQSTKEKSPLLVCGTDCGFRGSVKVN